MMPFQLDSRLAADCHELTRISDTHVLLMNNALVPWFILVPRVNETELHRLTPQRFNELMQLQLLVSQFVQTHFDIHKLNVGTIGNVVAQLHVHIIGRRNDDFCWPSVVWGNSERTEYSHHQVANIQRKIIRWLHRGQD